MYSPLWEWVDTVLGVIAGAISTIIAMVKWIAPKFVKVDEQIRKIRTDTDMKVEAVHVRITEHVEEIARLRAHREDDQRRLENIDKKLDRILERIPMSAWRGDGQ